MQKWETTSLFLRFSKAISLILCILLLFATQITPLYAQLSPARDLTGTWQSSVPGMWYEMDPLGSGVPMEDITATFAMDITQEGNQITIALYMNDLSCVTDPAYTQMYNIPGTPPVGTPEIDFTGTVSSSSFTANEITHLSGGLFTPDQLTGSFTTNVITATLSGHDYTDQNGIVVTRTSSPTSSPTVTTSPTIAPTSTPAWTANDLGSIALVKGPASFTSNGASVTAQTPIGAGTDIQTGSNAVVQVDYPSQGGVVSLGGNTEAAWLGLQYTGSAPGGYPSFTMIPSDPAKSINWLEEAQNFLKWTLTGAGVEFLLTGAINPYLLGLEVLIHGGILLVRVGDVHIEDTGVYKQIVQFTDGFLQGKGTEYTLSVNSSESVVQVISDSVIFLDPVTNNTITIGANQVLTLPNQQGGFTQQELNADLSSFNPNSINHWWTVAAPTSSSSDVLVGFLLIVIIIVIVVAVAAAVRRRKARTQLQTRETSASSISQQPRRQEPQMLQPAPSDTTLAFDKVKTRIENEKTLDQPAETLKTPIGPSVEVHSDKDFLFCANCGKQLPPVAKKFCPFCGSSLSTGASNLPPQISTPAAQPQAQVPQAVSTLQGFYPTKPPHFVSHGVPLTLVCIMMQQRNIRVTLNGFTRDRIDFKDDNFVLLSEMIPPEIGAAAKKWDEMTVLRWLAPYIPRTLAKVGIKML